MVKKKKILRVRKKKIKKPIAKPKSKSPKKKSIPKKKTQKKPIKKKSIPKKKGLKKLISKPKIKKAKIALPLPKKELLKVLAKKLRPSIKKAKKKKILKAPEKTKAIKREKYLKTDVPGFDQLFDKGYGVPVGSSILIEGGPGSGKTILCLATIMGLCKQGKKCLYMSFEEPEGNLIDHMRHFGWHVDEYIKKDLLRIKRFDAIDVSRSVEALLSAAKKELLIEIDPVLFPEDYDPDFVVIDSLSSIASAFSGHGSRFRIYMEQLFRYLEKNEITNFLIREVSTPTHIGSTFKEEGAAVSFLSDGIIVIYNVIYDSGKRESAMEILKMRGVSFKRKLVKMNIINKVGVIIRPNQILKKLKSASFQLT